MICYFGFLFSASMCGIQVHCKAYGWATFSGLYALYFLVNGAVA